jgi:hypothetical protein
MATSEGIKNDQRKEEEKDTNVQHLLHDILDKMNTFGSKIDRTNALLQELVQVCGVHLENNYEETLVKSVNVKENQMYYQSPCESIQQGINELLLQKEADKIKQNMKVEWSRTLNFRKQLFWKQINNANDAEQYEKWLGEDNPILPRKFRITEINGEPEDQKNIRANMAVERVKGEIQLLRMRSEKSQEKVINIDEQMIQGLKKKANGKILEILENRWRSDCEKEEKRSQERYRIKEIWQLDYVRKFGNSITKEKNQRKPKKRQSVQPTESWNDFADVVRHNSTSTSQRRNTRRIQRQEKTPYMRNIHSESQQQTSPKRLNNEKPPQNQDRYNYPNKRHSNNQQGTLFRKNGTTYIGKRVNQYFLGGGKFSGGERFKHQRFPKNGQNRR